MKNNKQDFSSEQNNGFLLNRTEQNNFHVINYNKTAPFMSQTTTKQNRHNNLKFQSYMTLKQSEHTINNQQIK